MLRDRVQLDNLRRRMPRDHPAYNQATALLEVKQKDFMNTGSFIRCFRIQNGEINQANHRRFVVR